MAPKRRLPLDPIAEARRQWALHGWEDSADGMALVTSVVRVQQVYLTTIDRVLRPLGLSFARYEVLMILHFSRKGELPLGKIGARLQVQPGAVTNAVDRLEAAGLVERRSHPTDGRGTLARLTAKGRRLARKATTALNEAVFEPASSLPDVAALVRQLSAIRAAADDFDS